MYCKYKETKKAAADGWQVGPTVFSVDVYMLPDFGKQTILSQLAFREIPTLFIEAVMVLLCWVVATLDLLHN